MMQKQPMGIKVLFWVYLVLGIFSLVWSLLVLGVGGLSAIIGELFNWGEAANFGSSSAWSGYLGILAAVVQIVVAFGLVGIQRWAWWLAVIGVGLTVVQGVIEMLSGGTFGFICGSLGLIIPAVVLVYLLTPGIRGKFKVEVPW